MGRSPALWLALLFLVIGLAVATGRRGGPAPPAAPPPRCVAPPPIQVTATEPSRAVDIRPQEDAFGLEAEPEPVPEPVSEAASEPPGPSTVDLQASASVGYEWFDNASGYRSAVEMAAARSKPIAVYFYTDWCGYCRQFESELLARARVEEFTKYLVKVRINPESGSEEREIAGRYGVRGYPAFFVHASADARPRKIRRQKVVGGERVLQTPAEFVATLERAIR